MKGCFVYFLYSLDGRLLYVGMTCRLTRRMQDHFDKQLVEIETWRKNIDRNNIILYTCNNKVDLVIYETYFINKYKPTKNQEKVYNQVPTFDLPYLEPIHYEYGERDRRTHTFKYYCKKYVNEPETRHLLPKEFEIIKEIYEKLGSAKMKALVFNKRRMEEALFTFDSKELIKSEIIKTFVPGFYTRKRVKEILGDIYTRLKVTKGRRSKDLEDIFGIAVSSTLVQGKLINGYLIQEEGVKKRTTRPEANGLFL